MRAVQKTIRVSVFALRKDGTNKMRNGRYLGAWITVPLVERNGAWAITPSLDRDYKPIPGLYAVTHAPSGHKVCEERLPLRKARKLLGIMAQLPDQTRWRRLRNRRHITKAMRISGREAVMREVLY